ncbi:hypothetical protein [Herpetosiphon llansteffanensis]|uniref:hypothetical protein n=1 Tax=Herpetosiphon llansteffanensis TaxID=2094568 RepID=UPI000D7CE651|nr:hypothetical protein [Herpetosiphon llansteffanensis]
MKRTLGWCLGTAGMLYLLVGGLISAHSQIGPSLRYAGLATCYPVGGAIDDFTLTVQVALAGDYQITHAVAVNGGAPSSDSSVFTGMLVANETKNITINGGSAAIAGSYTVIGKLFQVISGTNQLIAQTSATATIATPCIEPPTPVAPTAIANPSTVQADIRWRQQIVDTPSNQLVIDVYATNYGQGIGPSEAVLSYDPAVVSLIEAQPTREADWIRSHDQTTGNVQIALAPINPQDTQRLRLVFIQHQTSGMSTIRLVRDDGKDWANPLFLDLAQPSQLLIRLEHRTTQAQLRLRGKGYKPGERLSLWLNLPTGQTKAIAGIFNSNGDQDGTIDLWVDLPTERYTSIVVQGQQSQIIGQSRFSHSQSKSTRRSIPSRVAMILRAD